MAEATEDPASRQDEPGNKSPQRGLFGEPEEIANVTPDDYHADRVASPKGHFRLNGSKTVSTSRILESLEAGDVATVDVHVDRDESFASSRVSESLQAAETIRVDSYSGQSLSMRQLNSRKPEVSDPISSTSNVYVASQDKTKSLFALELKRKNLVRSEVEQMRKEVEALRTTAQRQRLRQTYVHADSPTVTTRVSRAVFKAVERERDTLKEAYERILSEKKDSESIYSKKMMQMRDIRSSIDHLKAELVERKRHNSILEKELYEYEEQETKRVEMIVDEYGDLIDEGKRQRIQLQTCIRSLKEELEATRHHQFKEQQRRLAHTKQLAQIKEILKSYRHGVSSQDIQAYISEIKQIVSSDYSSYEPDAFANSTEVPSDPFQKTPNTTNNVEVHELRKKNLMLEKQLAKANHDMIKLNSEIHRLEDEVQDKKDAMKGLHEDLTVLKKRFVGNNDGAQDMEDTEEMFLELDYLKERSRLLEMSNTIMNKELLVLREEITIYRNMDEHLDPFVQDYINLVKDAEASGNLSNDKRQSIRSSITALQEMRDGAFMVRKVKRQED